MSVPRYAWLVRNLLAGGGPEAGALPPTPAARAGAIAAIAQAITTRARRRRTVRAAGGAAVAAAAIAGVFAGSHVVRHALAPAASQMASSGGPEIVAHPAAAGASVLVSGAEAPLVEGRALASGSRIVTPPNGRAILSFSTGTSVELGEGAAQRVAMHPQLGGGLALVALVLRQHLKDVPFLELPHGIRIRDAGAVHLRDQGVQFALQGSTSLTIYRKMIPYFRPLNAD